MEIDKLLALSWRVQLALGSGYAAYLIAYAGIRGHHRAADAALTALIFSLVATVVLAVAPPSIGAVEIGAAAFVVTCLSGVFWRKWGRDACRLTLRALNVSWASDSPSAWDEIQGNSKNPLTQIAVQLDDGSWLRCDDARMFSRSPYGPCVLGANGDVALYLTHIDEPGKRSKELKTVRDDTYGDRMTYVPAGRIRQITMRHAS